MIKRCIKKNNCKFKSFILTFIQEKHINLILHKIKAHTSLCFNELADKLAKDRIINTNRLINLIELSFNSFTQFSLIFNNIFFKYKYKKFFLMILKSFS